MRTQINGPVQGNKALFIVRYKLRSLGLHITYPYTSSFILFNGRHFTFNPQRWSKYEIDLYNFKAIKHSDFHVICNETASQPGLIDNDTALSILNAMFYGKAIILTKTPTFHASVDSFTRELITSRLSLMYVLDLPNLAAADINNALNLLQSFIHYTLTDNEKVLIRSYIKEHFRFLLQPMRKTKIYHATKTYSASGLK